MFGRNVTPNQHRLAEEFVLLDNFYATGGNSADGHQWLTQANEVDYCMWPGYAKRSYGMTGQIRSLGWRCLHTNGIHMLLRLVQGQWPPAPKAVTPVEISQSEMRGEYANGWPASASSLLEQCLIAVARQGAFSIGWGNEQPERNLRPSPISTWTAI